MRPERVLRKEPEVPEVREAPVEQEGRAVPLDQAEVRVPVEQVVRAALPVQLDLGVQEEQVDREERVVKNWLVPAERSQAIQVVGLAVGLAARAMQALAARTRNPT